MKTKNNLPKYWVVQADQSNPDWKKVIDYLNKTYNSTWSGATPNTHYGYDGGNKFGGTNYFYDISNFKNSPVVLTIEEFVEMTEGFVLPEYVEYINEYDKSWKLGKIYKVNQNGTVNFELGNEPQDKRYTTDTKLFKPSTKEAFDKQNQKQEIMRKITHTQAQQIIDIACRTWKDELFTKWGREVVLKESIGISEEFYQTMRKACTSEQHQLFDEIFGKESNFKIGDWVTYEGSSGYLGTTNQIKSFTDDGDGGALDENGHFRDLKRGYRLATPEEIQKAKYIPKGTPCLVRDNIHSNWELVYSLGDGTYKGELSNRERKQVQVLDINNLPKY